MPGSEAAGSALPDCAASARATSIARIAATQAIADGVLASSNAAGAGGSPGSAAAGTEPRKCETL